MYIVHTYLPTQYICTHVVAMFLLLGAQVVKHAPTHTHTHTHTHPRRHTLHPPTHTHIQYTVDTLHSIRSTLEPARPASRYICTYINERNGSTGSARQAAGVCAGAVVTNGSATHYVHSMYIYL
ncbi:hypothetical protein K504DRAFT_25849 [Pleomassaria siparia CBS 279.74]|uniref:Uncharacterized protein n=1 Tax=Pleomassaria siparia CBS 279.74 TaxID=1314801 RepID=A0A6G1KS66_9PLEO|nr:hypothetical protein K504DRAFT_25849 [Pleomassaria siparia CBS 279.74]